MDNSHALCAPQRNGVGIDAFYLNVTHAYGWESAVYLLLWRGKENECKAEYT